MLLIDCRHRTNERCENTKVSSPKDIERDVLAESGEQDEESQETRRSRRENFNLHVVMVIQLAVEININKIHIYHKSRKILRLSDFLRDRCLKRISMV
jgi:hypothetical protein